MPSNVSAHGLLYDALYTFAMRMLNIGAALAASILVARLLGPAGKGVAALPMVEAWLVATSFGGLMSATSYFLLNEGAGRDVVGAAVKAALLFVIAGAAVVVPIAALSHALWAAPLAIAPLPAMAASFVVAGYAVGIRRVRYAPLLTAAAPVATLGLTAAGLFLIARTPLAAIVAWIAATTLVAVAACVGMALHARTLERGSPVAFSRFLRMALKAGATSLISMLNYRGDLYVVAVLLPPVELGLYSVATSAATGLLLPTQVATLVMSPHIGGLQRETAAGLTARCARNNLLAAAIVCGLLLAFAPQIIGFCYGTSFLPLVPALRILVLGTLALSIGSPISSYYTLKLGKPEIPLVLAGISAVLCVGGTVVLVPHEGITGAAIASTIAYVVGQGFGLWYFVRTTGISPRRVLVPTLGDFRVYADFLRRLCDDGAHLLTPLRNPNG